MRRREFITLLGGTAITWPVAARAQQPDRVRLLGILMEHADSNLVAQSWVTEFRKELAKLGWTEGSNLRIELRWANSNEERLKTFAKELVELRPDAIFARGTIETVALARETRTIPIVFAAVSDPIGSGFAKSLSRPGSNMTGFTNIESTLGGKWVALLKEIAPATVHVSLLFNPTTVAPLQFYLPSIQAAAQSLAVQVSSSPVHAKDEIEGIIAALARRPGGSLIAMPDNFTGSNLGLIGLLAARYRVPAIHYLPSYAETGGLLSYGVDFTGLFRQAAGYIDRVPRGASAADLPIQLPTKLELLINLKAAKTLDLIVPPSMLVAADQVIE